MVTCIESKVFTFKNYEFNLTITTYSRFYIFEHKYFRFIIFNINTGPWRVRWTYRTRRLCCECGIIVFVYSVQCY